MASRNGRLAWTGIAVLVGCVHSAVAADIEPDAPLLSLEAAYTGDSWRNAAGGVATGNRYFDNLDVTATLNAGQFFGVRNVKVFGYLLHNHGDQLADELTGSAQGISNIETTGAVRLYELWMEWELGQSPGSFRVGLYDLNAEFDAIETAGLFINPSHGIGPDFSQSGRNGPSIFPSTSLAVRYAIARGNWSWQTAMLDGVPGDPDRPTRTALDLSSDDGMLFVNEINYRTARSFRVGAGYWRYTGDFEDLSPAGPAGETVRNDNDGLYAMLETPHVLSRGAEQGARFFLRIGQAESRINPIEFYYGFGGAYDLNLGGRPQQVGLAVSIAELGVPYRDLMASQAIETHARETIIELTYRIELFDWLALQPDVQYMRHPGMDRSLESSWLFGLRFEVSRDWAW